MKPIHISYQLDFDELLASARARRSLQLLSWSFTYAICILSLIFGLVLLLAGPSVRSLAVACLFLGLLPAWLPVLERWGVRRQYQSRADRGQRVAWEITEQGLVNRTSISTS